ncbi:uncharacterized protein PAC_15159 [Phialocephala subalpina]|uniref:Uncharacterized protein n=1 Tax=Phialocephala subalpina TaxID=576137 RepID=A0A1L7XJP6_9HELO|nr:uncharacterized protein PAC_15159 [Phialocephala subalpina]
MSTSQSSQSTQAGPAGIIWSRFPPEVQFKILKEALCTEGVTGRGAPNIARLSLVCKDWEQEIQSRRARVPQKKKRENGKHGKIVRVAAVPSLPNPTSTLASPPQDVDNLESGLPPDHPDAEYLESDDDDASEASDTNSDSEDLTETQVIKEHKKAKQPELPPTWEDERNLEEPRKKRKGNLPPLLAGLGGDGGGWYGEEHAPVGASAKSEEEGLAAWVGPALGCTVGGNGCERGVWAVVPAVAAPQTWRAKMGPVEAAEKRAEAARMMAVNECILKVTVRLNEDNEVKRKFPVRTLPSFNTFSEEWTAGKEEIDGYQYDSSMQRLIITADGGPVHEYTASAMYSWLYALAQRNNRARANLAPSCKLLGLDNQRRAPSEKHPDCCLKLRGQRAPRIVIEVGFREDFDDLEADAKRWLYGSRQVHRVFLIDIEGTHRSEEFKRIIESKEGSKDYESYREMLPKEKDLVHDSEIYYDRRSYIYGVTAEELRDLSAQKVNELIDHLTTWHEKHFPLYVCRSATFYIYSRDASDSGEIELVGEQLYWTSDDAAQESLEELSRRLTYDDLFGDGSGHVVKLDDYLPAETLREALNAGLEDYTEEQMKATVARLLHTYDEWERIRKGKDLVQEEARGSKARPLRDQRGSGPSYTDSSTSSEHLPTQTTSSPSPPLPVRIPGHPSPPLGDSVASQPVVKKRKRGAVLDQLEQVGQGIKRFARKVSGGRKGL